MPLLTYPLLTEELERLSPDPLLLERLRPERLL